ncbi:MAG: 50S ribosomal protein L11 methyltransferase [Anaerolineae bacterium]|nr:50S ribosomal protein L11 methyltransferase [Anaerolineae bacterium]
MAWLEVSVHVNREAAEAVAEVLSRYAPDGVVLDFSLPEGPLDDAQRAIEQATMVTVKAYLPVDDEIDGRRRKVEEGLWHLSQIWSAVPEPVFRSVPEQDWSALWKAQIPVLALGHNVVIKPSWRDYDAGPDDIVLEMDPGMAFGTGLHPTTQLCVTAVEDLIRPGMSVLDLGTGTGILAMIAAKLGAAPLLAVDNDADAIAAARRNVEANRLSDQIELRHGSLEAVDAPYDLVLANILAPIIIRMAASGLATRLRSGGYLVVSGILLEQGDEVTAALEAAGLQVVERRQQEEWVALIATHPAPAQG